MENKTQLQLDVINAIKFPLIIGVVYIHAVLNDIVITGQTTDVSDFVGYNTLSYLFSDVYGRLCVPMFFFISGFLFFYRSSNFTLKTYREKLRKRFKTLLVPYVIWNILTLLFFFLGEILFPGLSSGRNKLILDYTILDFLSCFWDTSLIDSIRFSLPIYTPFWYIRDLMVVVLFTPLLYKLLKSRLKFIFLFFIVLMYICSIDLGITGLGNISFCFFSLGAYFSINSKNFIEFSRKSLWYALAVYILSLVAEKSLLSCEYSFYANHINVLSGLILLQVIFVLLVDKKVLVKNDFLTNVTFFIYACHMIPLSVLKKVAILLYPSVTDMSCMLIYILLPIIVIVCAMLVYYLMNRYLPSVLRVMTGMR